MQGDLRIDLPKNDSTTMNDFNLAYSSVLAAERLTIGLMTPLAHQADRMPDVDFEVRSAARADRLGFAALWARDVPLMIPQGTSLEAVALDDPFLWLSRLAAATGSIALGTAAAVLPLRHPLHLSKIALSMDRLTKGRFILGLGSGDRKAEFAAFGLDEALRGDVFRAHWAIVRSALSPSATEREILLATAGGYDLALAPKTRIPMLAVGSARQTLQWIAEHAEGWATYHREEERQRGRIGLWHSALRERAAGIQKPFVQSVHLDLLADPAAPAEPIELGLRVGRRALVDYFARLQRHGVAHVILHLSRKSRPVLEVVDELGLDVLPALREGAMGGKANSFT